MFHSATFLTMGRIRWLLRVGLSITLLAWFLVAVVPPRAHAATFVVTNCNDSGAGSLRQAISDSNDNGGTDDITFSLSCSTITLTSALPSIGDSVNILGPGMGSLAIDGAASSDPAVFMIDGATSVTISDLTIQNYNGGYGAVFALGVSLTIENMAFSDNSSAIYEQASTMTVEGSTFSNNSTGISVAGNFITVTGSTFSGNGTGIDIYGSASATVTGSTFSGNSNGIHANTDNFISVATSTFSGNGTGINTNGSDGETAVVASTFFDNGNGILAEWIDQPLSIGGNIFFSLTSSANCSGVFTDDGYNLSSDGTCVGGGPGSAANVTGLNLEPLSGTGPGQQVHIPGEGSAARGAIPYGEYICNGTATDQLGYPRPRVANSPCTAGAVEVDRNIRLTVSNITQDEGSTGPYPVTFTVSLHSPALFGGVTFDIATRDGMATVADNDYVAKSLTGQVIPAGSTTYTFDVTVNGDTTGEADEMFYVDVTNITNASVVGSATATALLTNDDPFDETDTVVRNCNNGGPWSLRQAISNANAVPGPNTITFEISCSTITLTSALPNIGDSVNILGPGMDLLTVDGANSYTILQNTSTAAISGLTFSNGYNDWGGAINNYGSLSLTNVRVSNNQADHDGGAIWNSGTLVITGSIFSNNSAVTQSGGAIWSQFAGTLTISSSIFSGNTAHSYGGGIASVSSSPITITGSTFTGNAAGADGGAIDFMVGTLTVTNSTFSGNSSDVGGGAISGNSALIVTNSTFSGNACASLASDILSEGGATITGSTFFTFVGMGLLSVDGVIYLAGNIFAGASPGCYTFDYFPGTYVDNGYNLSDDAYCVDGGPGSVANVPDLNLDALSGTGPGQQVHIPGAGSAALGAIPYNTTINNNGQTLACNTSTTDQLGNTHPLVANGPCTAGAVEVASYPKLTISSVTHTEGNSGTQTYTFTLTLHHPALANTTFTISTRDGTATAADNDYVAKSLTGQTIPAGSTTYTFDVTVNGDLVEEDDEVFYVDVTDAANITIVNGTGTGTITNDDTAGISLGGLPVDATEGGADGDYTLVLDTLPAAPVTINITTNGQCTVSPNPLTFTAGAGGNWNTPQILTVQADDDLVYEPSPHNCLITNTTASTDSFYDGLTADVTAAITDNDSLPQLSIDDVSQMENALDPRMIFTVSLSHPTYQPVTVNYALVDGTATAGNWDYSTYPAPTGTLTFTPGGSLTQTINVYIEADDNYELDETFFVNLSSPTNASIADDQGVGTILNDDASPQIYFSYDYNTTEGNSGTRTKEICFVLTNASYQTITFDYTTADDSATIADNDYAAASGTMTIPPYQWWGCILITMYGDTKFEPDETLFVNISNPTNATILDGHGIGTIRNDDTVPQINIDNVSVTEGNSGTTNATFTVSLSNATYQTVTVNYTTADDSATTADNDYAAVSGTLTFTPNDTSEIITVSVNGDTLFEPDETFFVNLSNPINATMGAGQGIGTITDDDEPALTIEDVTQSENGTFIFTATLDNATASGFTVDWTFAHGTTADADFVGGAAPTGATLTFAGAAGETQTFTVPVFDDGLVESTETFTVGLVNLVPSGAFVVGISDTATGTIINNDAAAVTIADVSLVENGTFIFTATLDNATAGGFTVDWTFAHGTTLDADFAGGVAPTGATLTFAGAAGETQTFTVPVFDDGLVEPIETFTVGLTNFSTAGGFTVDVNDGATGTITDNDSAAITIEDVTLAEDGTFTFTATLNNATVGGFTVEWTFAAGTTDAADYGGTLPTGATLTFAGTAGETQTFTVPVFDDGLVEPVETFTVGLANLVPSGAFGVDISDTATGTITDNEGPVIADNDVYTTNENQPLSVDVADGVLNGDSGGNGNPLQAVLVTTTTSGVLTLNADGSFAYTPSTGFLGTDLFTYYATDGTNVSTIATVTITVTLVNDTLVAHDDGADMPMNTSITLDVLANDIDPDGDPLHIAAVSSPTNGQAAVENGRIVYTPHIGFIGTDTFTYTAADDFGSSDTATVTIIVWQPIPLCADFDGSTNEIIRADVPGNTVTNGSVFCRVLTENTVYVRMSAEVGSPEVIGRGVIQAVDVFALLHNGNPAVYFNNPISVCLQGSGAFLYLDATVSPRAVTELPVYTQNGYTCAAVPNAGTVVLVGGAASMVNPAPEVSGPTILLTNCMVSTRDILNLRETPSASGAILRMIPYDVTLTALERSGSWFYVDYLGERGWVSAAYLALDGICGQ